MQSIIRLTLRIPEPLHIALKEYATRQNRSINAQIVYIIQEWLRNNGKD